MPPLTVALTMTALTMTTTLLTPAGTAGRPANAAPAGVTIDAVNATGNGCRKDTARVAMAPDRRAFTVTFSSFLAAVGVGTTGADRARTCKLHVRMNIPKGHTYGITRVDHRGYTDLAPGAAARYEALYDFPGRNSDVRHSSVFRGPRADNFDVGVPTPDGEFIEAPCGKGHQMKLESRLSVEAGTSDVRNTHSYLTLDSSDGVVAGVYQWRWRTCEK